MGVALLFEQMQTGSNNAGDSSNDSKVRFGFSFFSFICAFVFVFLLHFRAFATHLAIK